MIPGLAILAVALSMAVGAAGAAEDPNLTQLPRAERVRLLQARSWEMRAFPLRGKLSIDGRLDDEAWQAAEPVTDFFQRETLEGIPATEPTHVSVLYDDAHRALAAVLGWGALPSPPDRVTRTATGFRAEGVGAGHRVGLCLGGDDDRGLRATE